jgi:hypothetical protein
MIPEILASYALNLNKVREIVKDLSCAEMVAQPVGAPNHAAWTIGHLVYSAERIGGELGLEPWLPEDWAKRFGTGSAPVGDPAAYPDKESLLGSLDDAQKRLTERLRAMTDEDMNQPLPDVRHRKTFPTLGHAVLHILSSHSAFHVGQLAVWSRARS